MLNFKIYLFGTGCKDERRNVYTLDYFRYLSFFGAELGPSAKTRAPKLLKQLATLLKRVNIKIFQREFRKSIFIIFSGDILCKG